MNSTFRILLDCNDQGMNTYIIYRWEDCIEIWLCPAEFRLEYRRTSYPGKVGIYVQDVALHSGCYMHTKCPVRTRSSSMAEILLSTSSNPKHSFTNSFPNLTV